MPTLGTKRRVQDEPELDERELSKKLPKLLTSMYRFKHFLSCVGQTGRMRQKSILDEVQLQAELHQLLREITVHDHKNMGHNY